MATGPGVTILTSGPLFTRGSGPVREAGKNIVADLVEKGEREVKLQLFPGHGLVTGNYRRSINGEIVRDLNGLVHDSNVVYGPWLEGVSSRNQRSRFKGYHMFRNARQTVQRIAKGVANKRIAEAVRKLGGGLF